MCVCGQTVGRTLLAGKLCWNGDWWWHVALHCVFLALYCVALCYVEDNFTWRRFVGGKARRSDADGNFLAYFSRLLERIQRFPSQSRAGTGFAVFSAFVCTVVFGSGLRRSAGKRQHLCACLQFVQIVGPPLHQFAPLVEPLRAVIRAPESVTHAMG